MRKDFNFTFQFQYSTDLRNMEYGFLIKEWEKSADIYDKDLWKNNERACLE